MKNVVLAAIAALSVAPAAFAAGNSQTLSATDAAEIRRIVPGADLTALSPAQAGALSAAIYSDDAASNRGGTIRSILAGFPAQVTRDAGADASAGAIVPHVTTKGSDDR